MGDDKIWRNISRQLAGESNAEEKTALDEWLNSGSLNRGTYKRLFEIWNYKARQIEDTSRIYRRFRDRVNNYEKNYGVRRFVYYALRIAAILFLLVSISVLINSYFTVSKSKLTYYEIAVPKGNRTSVVLPDSSKVWISNDSKLKYPSRFTGRSRELFLTGEAYFEVTHDKKKPFIVNIGKNRIRVLGTKFSVYAYPEDNIVEANLLSGKIQFDIYSGGRAKTFHSYTVEPGHSMVYNKTGRIVRESEIPDNFYDYWLKGVYTFKNERLESLARKIKRIYNTEIVFEDDYLKNKRYNGSFSVDDNIFTFMEAIRQTSVEPIEYRFEKNRIFIKLIKKIE